MRLYVAIIAMLLTGCAATETKPKVETVTTVVHSQVVCQVKQVPLPDLQPVSFTTVVVEGVAWISLSPVEHSTFQTNHAKLVGYSRELQTELAQVQACIDRHNRDAK